MDGIVVKSFYGSDDRCRLSVLSPVDLSTKVACVDLSLPSYIDDQQITCGSSCGLLYFNDDEGNIVLCNLTTKQLKPLPPPAKSKPPLELIASGLGYDSKSDDFKVVRFLRQEGGHSRGYNVLCELYSLKSGVWKGIPTPDAIVSPGCGVYIGGRCYWTASLGISFGGSSCEDNYVDDILSFDFATENFYCLHSPPSRERQDIAFEVVEYRGSLGAIGFGTSDDPTRGFGFEFWVREECSWTKVFDVVLSNVGRMPLGLIDGRFLFLERKGSNKLYQLVVYDRITKEWKELDIFCYRMEVTRYVEGQVALPDAMPMQRSYTHEEEKQIKKRRRDWSNDDDSCEDEEDDDDNEEEEDKQIKKRRRERSNDYKSDIDDDSCEDDDDNEEEEDNVDED